MKQLWKPIWPLMVLAALSLIAVGQSKRPITLTI